MRVTERGRVTIPKDLREQYGLGPDVEVEFFPIEGGIGIRKRVAGEHPIDKLVGILHSPGSTDEYIEEIRGR